jgi:hypothetical protein
VGEWVVPSVPCIERYKVSGIIILGNRSDWRGGLWSLQCNGGWRGRAGLRRGYGLEYQCMLSAICENFFKSFTGFFLA